MPAPKGQRDATRIRMIARSAQDYMFAKKGSQIDQNWLYSQLREIEDIAHDMNASTGKRDARLRKKKPAAKKRR